VLKLRFHAEKLPAFSFIQGRLVT